MDDRIDKISAVAFDIDGTLYSNGRMYCATGFFVLRHLPLFRAFGIARKQVRREYPVANLHERTVELTARKLRWDIDKTREALRTVIYRDWEQRLRNVKLCSGVRDLISDLRRSGIRTAALSDFPVQRKIDLLGLEGMWDLAFTSEDTGHLKPHREPFDHLVRELGLPPERILYVGNSYSYDVEGAAAVGLRTAHFTRVPRRDGVADFSFFRYEDLGNWLRDRLEPVELD